ncbi:hypothetical protein MJO28_003592, partial [Puccinia striiformis f. sp. tritici]
TWISTNKPKKQTTYNHQETIKKPSRNHQESKKNKKEMNQFKFEHIPSSTTTTKQSKTSRNRTKHRNRKTHKLNIKKSNSIQHENLQQDEDEEGQLSFKEIETRLPDQVLELILNYLPDRFGFKSIIRSRTTTYGFNHSNQQEQHEQPLSPNESEGTHWISPPTHLRLINRRWARIGAEVFFKHLSINSINRLESLVELFNMNNPSLPSLVRTIMISMKGGGDELHQRIRTSLSKLFKRLTGLRSLSIRGCSPGILFPAPLEIDELFLPQSIIRFAIEFRSQEDSALLSSILGTPRTTALNHPDQLSPSSNLAQSRAYPIRQSELIELHAAELNLLLVCLPKLESLHLSNFHSQSHRPLFRYTSDHHHSQEEPGQNPLVYHSIRSLILDDCNLSDDDAMFFAHRFNNLESLSISNQFINAQHIKAINLLLSSTPIPTSSNPKIHRQDPASKIANKLEKLSIKLLDFQYDASHLLLPSTTPTPTHRINRLTIQQSSREIIDGKLNRSSPIYTSGSHLSTRYDELDLTNLHELRSLTLQTPTLATLIPSDSLLNTTTMTMIDRLENKHKGALARLESLEIDARLLYSNHPYSLDFSTSILHDSNSLKTFKIINESYPDGIRWRSSDDLYKSVIFNDTQTLTEPDLIPLSSTGLSDPSSTDKVAVNLPLWYRKLSFQFLAWNMGFDWSSPSSFDISPLNPPSRSFS